MNNKNHYLWLWSIWGLWIAALLLWQGTSVMIDAIIFIACLIILLFLLSQYPSLKRKVWNNKMVLFKSKNKELTLSNSTDTTSSPATELVSNNSSTQEVIKTSSSKKVTYIAQHSKMQGEIFLEGDIHINGVIEGKIECNGMITVMLNGNVQGELIASAININGIVDGICHANTVEILEQGRVQGTIRSNEFSVNKGGLFIGTSEQLHEQELLPANQAEETETLLDLQQQVEFSS